MVHYRECSPSPAPRVWNNSYILNLVFMGVKRLTEWRHFDGVVACVYFDSIFCRFGNFTEHFHSLLDENLVAIFSLMSSYKNNCFDSCKVGYKL